MELEEQLLPARDFEELLTALKKHEGAYRKHLGTKDPEHPARERLENLHQMQRALRVPLEDLVEQGPALFGP